MIEIEKLTEEDAQNMMDLIRKVHDGIERTEWYAIDDLEYYKYYLQEDTGVGYKAFDRDTGELGGVFLAILPQTKALNLGYDIGMSSQEADKVAVMDTVAILPEFRGNNLQYRLMQAAEKDLKRQGYHYLMCTVHPDNCFSLRNVLKQGYEIVTTKEKYGGYLRHILLKRI